ncbi:MAG TPA: RICIN domain-containing protein [Streptomyces sp.]|nr:RICIN domain-containing protein [Streptomyces sp.]
MIIARDCGLALDTALGNQSGNRPHLWPPHADRHQLWFLHPSGVPGEVLIVSAANGLALDSTTDSHAPELLMWEPHAEPWQRWRLRKSPDGAAFEVQAVHSQRFLTASEAAERKWRPWFKDRSCTWAQQWIFALPHGGDPAES